VRSSVAVETATIAPVARKTIHRDRGHLDQRVQRPAVREDRDERDSNAIHVTGFNVEAVFRLCQ